jgi:hypothetical protein
MEKPQREKLKPKFRVKGSGQGDIIGVESGLKKNCANELYYRKYIFFSRKAVTRGA